MARTHRKHTRLIVGGYDLSGDVRSIGALPWTFEADEGAALTDEVMNVLIGQPTIAPGVVNSFFNNAAAGVHTLFSGQGGEDQILTALVGAGAAPLAGSPAFCGRFPLLSYMAGGEGAVGATLTFGNASEAAPDYGIPWGVLLHPSGQETGANAGTNDSDYGVQTTDGGFGVLHILATDGTVTFSIDDSPDDSVWSNLLTFTLGGDSIGAEIVSLADTATVERYLRWQAAPGTATAFTFVMSFVRGTGV